MIPLIAVHLFVFYYGIMADITPPVGLATFAAAPAQGQPWKDAYETGDIFRALAAKWPGSSDLLSKRMQQINLDATGIARVEPDVIRDLQRVCSFCASRGKCRHDLADDPGSSTWRDYCPNVPTFDALVTARASRSKTR